MKKNTKKKDLVFSPNHPAFGDWLDKLGDNDFVPIGINKPSNQFAVSKATRQADEPNWQNQRLNSFEKTVLSHKDKRAVLKNIALFTQ